MTFQQVLGHLVMHCLCTHALHTTAVIVPLTSASFHQEDQNLEMTAMQFYDYCLSNSSAIESALRP